MKLGKKASKMYKERKNVAVKGMTNTTAMLIHEITEDYVIWSFSFSEECHKSKLIYTKDERIIFRACWNYYNIDEFENIYSI